MEEFEFTLYFELKDKDQNRMAVLEALGAQGCTDALVGVGVQGQVALQFCRKAPSLEVALDSAIRDAKKALPKATLVLKDMESQIK